MSRMHALWSASPRKVLGGLFAVLAATGIAVGSGANFNSTSANPSNVFSAGTISQSNSGDGSAVLTVSGMKPGDSANGTVDIANTGDLDGTFTLSQSNLTDADGLADGLNLKIEDLGDPSLPGPDADRLRRHRLGHGHGPPGQLRLLRGTPLQVHRHLPRRWHRRGGQRLQGASTSVDYTFTATS